MDIPYSNWVARWEATLAACEKMGGDNQKMTIAPPATLDEVLAVEENIGHALPASFRKVVLDFSASVDIYWFLPKKKEPSSQFREIFCGGCDWDLSDLVRLNEEKQSWVSKVFPHVDDPYDRVWHHKLALSPVANGDYLAFDLSVLPDPPVVYLSHDDGEGHGYRLGHNFVDFIERWSLLGCPGNEDWQMMPFLPDSKSGLDPHGENAQNWRKWFGLRTTTCMGRLSVSHTRRNQRRDGLAFGPSDRLGKGRVP